MRFYFFTLIILFHSQGHAIVNKVDFFNDLISGNKGYFFYNLDRKLSKNDNFFQGQKIEKFDGGTLVFNLESKFRPFYFRLFEFSLPLNLNSIEIAPIFIDPENNQEELISPGFRFLKTNGEILFQAYPLKPFVFKKPIGGQSIFRLPSIKNSIFTSKSEDVFKDLFLKDIRVNKNDSFKDIGFKLFMAHLRMKYLPVRLKTLGWSEEKSIGVVEPITSKLEEEKFRVYEIYLLNGRSVFPWSIKLSKKDPLSITLFNKFLSSLGIRKNSINFKNILLKEYQNLSFKDKKSIYARYLLLSAWSFDRKNENLLKTLINTSEDVNANLYFLGPLYNLAFARYGNNFSSLKGRKKIKGEIVLNEKIKEENNLVDKKRIETSSINTELLKTPEEILQDKLKNSSNGETESGVNNTGIIYSD